ncbi:MAG: hypothetical protein AB9835_12225 [Eubacteriales bacterium]
MTATKRKSAPTAATVEGTNAISQENDTTLPYIFQDPDEKTHLRFQTRFGGYIVIYSLVKEHLAKLYRTASSHIPDCVSALFIKTIADSVETAYLLGTLGHPNLNTDYISPDKAEPQYRDGYSFLYELISSAYQQGLSKEPYDLYKGNWQDIQTAQ